MSVSRLPFVFLACSTLLLGIAMSASAPRPPSPSPAVPKAKPRLKSASTTSKRQARRASAATRSSFSARFSRASAAPRPAAPAAASSSGPASAAGLPRHTSVSGLTDRTRDWGVGTRHSVDLGSMGQRSHPTAEDVKTLKTLAHAPPQLGRALSTQDSIARVKLGNRTEPLRRVRSVGGVHPEVAPFRATFLDGQVRERVLQPTETLYIYHPGDTPRPNARFFTAESFSTGRQAQESLALPGRDPPTSRSTVVFSKPTVCYSGRVGPAFGHLGGASQHFVPNQHRSENKFEVRETVRIVP